MPYTTLISTQQLAERQDESWLIADCRFDLQHEAAGRDEYRRAHIPGAVYVSLSHDLAGPRSGRNGRHPLPSAEAMRATFGRLGIEPGAQVIAYDQDVGMFASRLWWMLRYMGHDAVAVLDGGWAKWTREGRPTRSGDELRPPRRFEGAPRRGLHVPVDDVLASVRSGRLADGASLLVDARGPERYEGQVEPLDRVAGHIPGAVNHYYKWNVSETGTLRPAEDLRERYTALIGSRAPERVVMYCGSGVSACHNLLAMTHAGLTGARLYAGSWSEWAANPEHPVATGQDDTPQTRGAATDQPGSTVTVKPS